MSLSYPNTIRYLCEEDTGSREALLADPPAGCVALLADPLADPAALLAESQANRTTGLGASLHITGGWALKPFFIGPHKESYLEEGGRGGRGG